ncbi:MAG TPA: YraN family protein [Vicinamibacterales bacterium]|jgi:putative endonuclease
MTVARFELGKTGEELACRELTRRGYAILARRWRQRVGEIDIIARDGETIVFVEVKARDGRAFGAPAEAVSAAKQRRIAQLAIMFLTRNGLANCRCRFDVVSVDVGAGAPIVQVFRNAFDAAVT